MCVSVESSANCWRLAELCYRHNRFVLFVIIPLFFITVCRVVSRKMTSPTNLNGEDDEIHRGSLCPKLLSLYLALLTRFLLRCVAILTAMMAITESGRAKSIGSIA